MYVYLRKFTDLQNLIGLEYVTNILTSNWTRSWSTSEPRNV